MVVHIVKQRLHNSSSGGPAGYVLRFLLRFFQFVLALTVAGLYGQDLHKATKLDAYYDSKWIFAVVVAGLSAATTLVYALPKIKSYIFFPWDFVLFILWTALFGIFGKMYFKEDAEGNAGILRMQRAVWIDLVNMLLWLITALYGGVLFFIHRNGSTLHTGRAEV